MKLPYRDSIRREQLVEKLTTYALNFEHKDGKHKARLFKAKLGITVNNQETLITAIFEAVNTQHASYTTTSQHGKQYVIDFIMETQVGTSKIRSAWIIPLEENYPRLTTIYPI
ncbi:DUF6883 domain-containing protein [Gloeocapsa sp. PCC 73106]|uniref:DUF6883 domain-containing protein n=1 Tax=Gloeocapsa sp. PCC 73106 TaxID=102232 RepID=UPI0002AD0716|nr:DUF6883 domain-containing protein [Gloeocapsa sp. PCC 73106]ELR99708.1 hypothetical protein GLO73106DRAFT_00035600 [Gloeocapsa sp. PCC 73106]